MRQGARQAGSRSGGYRQPVGKVSSIHAVLLRVPLGPFDASFRATGGRQHVTSTTNSSRPAPHQIQSAVQPYAVRPHVQAHPPRVLLGDSLDEEEGLSGADEDQAEAARFLHTEEVPTFTTGLKVRRKALQRVHAPNVVRLWGVSTAQCTATLEGDRY